MKELLKDEHPGDLLINNIIIDVFRDDVLCKYQSLDGFIDMGNESKILDK